MEFDYSTRETEGENAFPRQAETCLDDWAGELIQVRDDAKAWEGAAERLLHNFGLSLLVPEDHYAD